MVLYQRNNRFGYRLKGKRYVVNCDVLSIGLWNELNSPSSVITMTLFRWLEMSVIAQALENFLRTLTRKERSERNVWITFNSKILQLIRRETFGRTPAGYRRKRQPYDWSNLCCWRYCRQRGDVDVRNHTSSESIIARQGEDLVSVELL